MRCLVALSLLAACEKDQVQHLHVPPARVGDRLVATFQSEDELVGPDGVHHHARSDFELSEEPLEVRDGATARLRVTFAHYDHRLDGHVLETMSGTYELSGGAPPVVVRVDGAPLSPAEREFFAPWHVGDDSTVVNRHGFRRGEVYRPTDDEHIALGLPATAGPLVLRVTEADDLAVVLEGSYDLPPDGALSMHVSTRLSLTSGARSIVDDVTFMNNGSAAGHGHSTLTSRSPVQR